MKKPSTTNAALHIEWLNTAWTVVTGKPPAEPAEEVPLTPKAEPAPKKSI